MVVFDVVECILLRSDVKDLISWKVVCKTWYSLISSPRFVIAHLKTTCDNNYSRNSGNELGHVRIAMPTYWKIPNERSYQHNPWKVVGSSNGLVCISPYGLHALILVSNPWTREIRKLPMAPMVSEKNTSGLCLGFGYDSSTDDYKVVMGIKKSNDVALVQVLSLKSNTWKLIGQFNYRFLYDMPGMLLNGKLHWIVFDYNTRKKEKEKAILSFDLSREEFKVIPQPNDSKYVSAYTFLGIVEDQLCIFKINEDKDNHLPRDIWVMRSYNVEQSWELFPNNYEMKHEVVHHMKIIEYYSPNNKRMSFFCDDHKCLSRVWTYIVAHRFVPSLVSLYAGRPSHAKNNKTSVKAWSIKAFEGEEGQHSQPILRRIIIKASEKETRKTEEVYRREVGDNDNLYFHNHGNKEIEEILTKIEGVTLSAERGRGREELEKEEQEEQVK